MGYKYSEKVLKDVEGTSASEQLVLLALAHHANDKTGQCFPSIERLADETHLKRSTIFKCLNSLRDNGLLQWKSGGRKKSGRALSNLYTLTLEKASKGQKKVATPCDELDDDVDNSESRVHQVDPAPSTRWTPQGPFGGPCTVHEMDPNIHNIYIEHSDEYNPPAEAAGSMPGRFEFGVARRDGKIDDVLRKVEDAKKESRREMEKGPVQLAMEAACTDKVKDRITFGNAMLMKKIEDCYDVTYRFISERDQGEFKNIRNLAALLTKRLSALPDDPRKH